MKAFASHTVISVKTAIPSQEANGEEWSLPFWKTNHATPLVGWTRELMK